MAGCYGNDPEDRYYERMLDRYLDSLDDDTLDEDEYDDEEEMQEEDRAE